MNRMSFLIVDDFGAIRNMVIVLLVRNFVYEHNFKEAENGNDALYFLETEEFDFVIMNDVIYGMIDGVRLIKKIRAKSRNLKIIVLASSLESADNALMAGADDYVLKPFLGSLIGKIEKFCPPKILDFLKTEKDVITRA